MSNQPKSDFFLVVSTSPPLTESLGLAESADSQDPTAIFNLIVFDQANFLNVRDSIGTDLSFDSEDY